MTYSISSRQADHTHEVDIRRNAEEKIMMPQQNKTKLIVYVPRNEQPSLKSNEGNYISKKS